jgi:RNA 2',3'-cyclic 3'-phosphodiesterase
MRLFVAVDLDETARAAIAEEQRRIGAAMGDARSSVKWVKPAQMHLTLVFLGEVSEAHAATVVEAIASPVHAAPFAIVFQELGVFPSHGGPRALWIGVTHGAAELVALQNEIAQRAAGVAAVRSPTCAGGSAARRCGARGGRRRDPLSQPHLVGGPNLHRAGAC